MEKPVPGVICALMSKGKVIIVKNEAGWGLPSAPMLEGQLPANAARQLIKELCGQDTELVSMPGLVSEEIITGGRSKRYLMHLCILKPTGKVKLGQKLKWYKTDKKDITVLKSPDYEILKKIVMEKEATYYSCVVEDEELTVFKPMY
jgi:hypothetical protein